MRTITKADIQYAEGIAYRTCPIKDFDHPLWKECLSAARYGLVDAARKYDPDHAKQNWKAFMAIRVRGEVREIIRKERVQCSVGLTHRSRNNQDHIKISEYDTIWDIASDSHQSMNKEAVYDNQEIGDVMDLIGKKFPLRVASESESPEDILLAKEITKLIYEAMDFQLPAKESYVLDLFYFQDMTIPEIRKYSRVSEDEIQALIESGLKHLRELLKELE
ncbi:MAG: sigma-70 family RNA polymerase sigma factor [Chloroflexi bacterium]|nr:MAG: sigma-70 family RNA polymerase sigma factor [Chloroflexota bacterium]